jgi:hypothetical protein
LHYQLLFANSCEEKNSRTSITPTPQPIQHGAMLACGEKPLHHTATDATKQCKHKTQHAPLAVLWLPQNKSAHIKREKDCRGWEGVVGEQDFSVAVVLVQSHTFKAVNCLLCFGCFGGELWMVEIEVHKSDAAGAKASETASLDVNAIIGKVKEFVDSVRDMGAGEENMTVNVEDFNVSVGKEKGEYDFNLKLNLVVKPKNPQT